MSVAPKKFLNETSNAVNEVIEGLLLTYPNKLQRLAGHDVVLANPIPNHQKVRLLTGGGSGHEPCFGGWVGKGMLTAAVCGGIFASPSVKSILAAIRAITPVSDSNSADDGGCLILVLNYTGDRLNFGMACELANAEGRRCKMVIVSDDCAIGRDGRRHTGARGVAGCVLVLKIAGAAAAAGKSLEQVAEVAKRVTSRIGSLGVALDAVTLPGATKINARLDGGKIEIGLGVHGEAGIRQSTMITATEIAKEMVDTIYDFGYKDHNNDNIIRIQPGQNVAIVVNNLGGASCFELFILARDIIQYMEAKIGCNITRSFVGTYMTSFNMHGASLSIFSPDRGSSPELLNFLDAETDAPAWSKVDVLSSEAFTRPSLIPFPEVAVSELKQSPPEESNLDYVLIPNFCKLASFAINAACQAIIEGESKLTEWDTIVGDGDCGFTMLRGAKEIQKRLEQGSLGVSSPVQLFSDLADAISASMGGTSGILFELILRKMSSSLTNAKKAGGVIYASALSSAFVEGVHAASFYGGATVGCRTMMDALLPAADVAGSLKEMALAAEKGAESTAQMNHALAGRSSYLNEETLMNTPDPGAKAVDLILKAVSEAVGNGLI
mmetsp:Transcript_20446/g.29146  ORF Transcript_20446/g.29146 Transcript_20446/m.29146 type:complete len:609 (-) Transcript_20446:89-1915(-)